MKRIGVRVFIYFGLVIVVFTAFIGLIFTRFNKNNILGAYKNQIENLATVVAKQTAEASALVEAEELEIKAILESRGQKHKKKKKVVDAVDDFIDYLQAIEDFSDSSEQDIWVLQNPYSEQPLNEDLTNINLQTVNLPTETKTILDRAYDGKKKSYVDYDDIYKKNMIHMAVPIRNGEGIVIGAVLVTGPVDDQQNTITQYEKYMMMSLALGLLVSLILSIFFSRQIVRPIKKMKEAAIIMAAGDYSHKTGVKRRDELGSLAISMDSLSVQLAESQEYRESIEQNRRDFFSNVSHELRTPIAVVKGYVDSMADGYVTDKAKQQEYMSRIQNECNSMERLVSDLLVLSRMQNPDYELNMDVINVIAVAQDSMRGMRILMQENNMTGNVEFDDVCSFIDGDYDRIRQLFTILIQNAVKYANPHTSIDVFIKKEIGDTNKIVIIVRDYGAVIPKSECENVFEKFYRASTHGEKEGSGLGLVVASNIVKRHSGTIEVESNEKEGTRFIVKIPETSAEISSEL